MVARHHRTRLEHIPIGVAARPVVRVRTPLLGCTVTYSVARCKKESPHHTKHPKPIVHARKDAVKESSIHGENARIMRISGVMTGRLRPL